MRNKRVEHPNTNTMTIENPKVENEIMKLVVDSYLHGAQTCELHDGTVLGVSIHQGDNDNIHLFVDEAHKLTVEVQNGVSRISVMKNTELDDIPYIVPFTKCLGLSEGVTLKSFMGA